MRDADRQPGRWRTWTLLAVAAGIGIATIVALVTMLADAGRDRDAALRLQEASSNRVILAARFEAAMARSEASLGRFVISGDRSLGTLYSDNWRSSGLLLDRLDGASREFPEQARIIAYLRRAWIIRGNELSDTALRTAYGQNDNALARYYQIRTSPALTTLTNGIADVISIEQRLLAQRSRRVDAAVARANGLTTLVSTVGVLLVAGLGSLAFVTLRAAQRRQREEERAEELETAVAVRTAELSAANEQLVAEMTTRAAAEEQLRQAQKMDAIGQLTGGIAHDFNNMLAVVLGGVELAKRRMLDGQGDPVRHLDSALEGADRAAALTKRLLAFARAEPLLPTAVDPDRLIAGMSDLLDRTLGERIEVRHIARISGWQVYVDRHQLENALLNLAVNARDAMDGDGTLTIATAQITLRPGEVDPLPAGEYIRISVSDTGTGIAPQNLGRIFEPFFTTKPSGKGTGLGLSQVFGYVRQSNGALTVDSAVGMGTTVSVFLPRRVLEAPVATLRRPPEALRLSAGARLLVVEDDRRVLAATCDSLREIGHEPLPCHDPADAAAMLAAHTDIALVVSDVLMPGQTGPELIAELRRTRPDLRALFVTGYAGDTIDAAAFGTDPVLRKPFTITALAAAIDAALAEHSGPLERLAAA